MVLSVRLTRVHEEGCPSFGEGSYGSVQGNDNDLPVHLSHGGLPEGLFVNQRDPAPPPNLKGRGQF